MFLVIRGRRLLAAALAALLPIAALALHAALARNPRIEAYTEVEMRAISYMEMQSPTPGPSAGDEPDDLIKWVDFGVPYAVLLQAMEYDIGSYGADVRMNWIELLAYAAAKGGGKFSAKRSKHVDDLARRLTEGERLEDIRAGLKYYDYYLEAYTAVLGGFLGEYRMQAADPNDKSRLTIDEGYGLIAFSPIAKGYGYGDWDDFGSSRNYGFSRVHLGHDMMGSIGTPIVAVEGGVIEALGWNQYGGWRIGIRSHDKKRYYYYAHLRRNHPYHLTLEEGGVVRAGDVIGYMGMTGYSVEENVNNIKTPHLHFGMQLIFDESQKEGPNEIWIDVYQITKLLQHNRCAVYKDELTKDYFRVYEPLDEPGPPAQ